MTQFQFFDFPLDVQQEQMQRFKGICALYGYEAFLHLQDAHVVVIGNGGVGSWIAESLCRTAVGNITLVDFDNIELSNSNRQLHTLSSTIGQSKADCLGARLKDINPYLNLRTFPKLLCPDSIEQDLASILELSTEQITANYQTKLNKLLDPSKLALKKYQLTRHIKNKADISFDDSQDSLAMIRPNLFVAEAIDDLKAKAKCVDFIHRLGIPLICSGGAGGRIDPSRLQLGDVANAKGDQLIKNLRTELRRDYGYPKGEQSTKKKTESTLFNILCSFSDEKPMRSKDRCLIDHAPESLGFKNVLELPSFGASVTVTASAGLLIASVLVRWIIGKDIK